MKTSISIIILLFYIIGCSDDSDILSPFDKFIYKKIAFNSLNEPSKESLTKDWRLAIVEQGKYQFDNNSHSLVINSEHNLHFILYDPDYELFENQLLVAVIFNTIHDPLLGPLIIIIDYKSKIVIGSVLRL